MTATYSTFPEPREAVVRLGGILNDSRPKVLLTGDNRLLSELAGELGSHLRSHLYLRSGEVVQVEDGEVKPISPQQLRTLSEEHVVCCRMKRTEQGAIKVGVTMSESEARGILASVQFREKLPLLRRVNAVRLPTLRDDGTIALLPKGYDAESQTFTVGSVVYREDMPLSEARNVMADLFGEFEFADGSRSLAVAVAALVGMGASALLPAGALRPAFIVTKNAEGAGATTLARCVVSPFYGPMITKVLPDDDAETRKSLITELRAGKQYLVFDNVKLRIGGAAIEALLSSSRFGGRLLGTNEKADYENSLTIIFTGNGAAVAPDMRRRALFVALRLSVERAEDKHFRRPLTDEAIKVLRPSILAAVWSFIRDWDEKRRPKPVRSHSAFSEWAEMVGGIVEAAGYACPLETARVAEEADQDVASMRALASAMYPGRKYTPSELADICRSAGAFDLIVGDSDGDMTPSHRSMFGKVLKRYEDRWVGDLKFLVEGQGRQRRYEVESRASDCIGAQVNSIVPPRASKNTNKPHIGETPIQTYAPMQADVPPRPMKSAPYLEQLI